MTARFVAPHRPPSSRNVTKPIFFALTVLGPFPLLMSPLWTKDTCHSQARGTGRGSHTGCSGGHFSGDANSRGAALAAGLHYLTWTRTWSRDCVSSHGSPIAAGHLTALCVPFHFAAQNSRLPPEDHHRAVQKEKAPTQSFHCQLQGKFFFR